MVKNKLSTVIFMALAGFIQAQNDDVAQLAVALTHTGVQLYAADQQQQASLPTQKNFIKHICWLFEHNPYFYKLKEYQKDMDYAIAVFKDHIESLENKIASKPNGLKSRGMILSVCSATLSALSAYSTYYFFNERKTTLAAGDVFSLKSTNEKTLDLMILTVSSAVVSALLAAVSGKGFYKVFRYQERLSERLERDKKILALLEAEKATLEGKKINGHTKEALNKVLNSIVEAINSVVETV